MGKRLIKQIAYGIFYLFFFAGIIYGSYVLFIRPAPSCFDKIRNQNEEGVDCGGPCAAACIPAELRPIVAIDRILKFSSTPSSISILAKISNANLDYAAKNFSYKFNFYKANGDFVGSLGGNSFIYAGEVKYLLLPNASLPPVPFSKIDLKIENVEWLPGNRFSGPPNVAVSGVATAAEASNLSVDGQITNRDSVSFPAVTAVAIFRGQFGQIAGASQTEISNLLPNETRKFSIIHPLIPSVDLNGTSVFVYSRRP